MTVPLSKLKEADQLEVPAMLQEAFVRFSEASTLLQEKYETLAREAEQLRIQLKKKEEEVKRKEKLATLGETAAALAHEIRNPLGAIKLFLSILREDLNGNQAALDMIDNIDKSVASMDNVVSNILHFSRSRSLKMAPLNLHSLIQEEINSCRARYKDSRISSNLLGNPFICGNECGLRQVFGNILLNAVQATSFKGHIEVALKDIGQEHIGVTISDNGPGVPEELLDVLFDPFVTTRNEGTGLGLAIASGIIEQHGGEIKVFNNKGACFEIILPRAGTGK
ncbi:MAG: hypothetical protein D6719_10755 [Candidatus Dadabacteria bacterium]|nr:MAG: hypothetical protein D6719_10755 [Candidatus Dadabacteria bacterium]